MEYFMHVVKTLSGLITLSGINRVYATWCQSQDTKWQNTNWHKYAT